VSDIVRLVQAHTNRRQFIKSGAAFAGTVAFGGGLLEACQGSTSSTTTGKTTLNFGAWQAPDTLDPSASGLAAANRVNNQVYDPLVWQLAGSQTILPGLATSWAVSTDATTYTFKLHQGVKFHDGTPFDANAVKFTFDRIIDPATKATQAIGALGPYDHTEVIDPNTVKVVFKEPYSPFLNLLSNIDLAPVSPAAVKKYGADFGSHPVGTGPFMVKDYVPRSHVTLVRNPDYNWAPSFFGRNGPAALTQINWNIVPNDSSRMGTLSTGENDIVEYLIPQYVPGFKANSKLKVLSIDAPGSPRVIQINVTKPPTDELAVRQAMLHAVDQKAIVKALFQGVYAPAYTPLEPPTLGYDASLQTMYPPDPAKARQLLDAAGWKAGADGLRQRGGAPLKPLFINIADDGFDGVAQIVQSQMRAVGIDLQLTSEAWPAVATTYNRGSQNFAEDFYWSNDPSLLYVFYGSSQIATGFNFAHYNNPAMDQLLAQAAAVADSTKRNSLYQQASKLVMSDAVIIPIQQKRTVMGLNNKIQGLKFGSVTYPLLYGVSWAS
jgi:peptide/nickel transport system substrate-binding protein